MTDKAIAKLIDTINSGAQNMPSMVDTMVHQYVVAHYVGAIIYAVITVILISVAHTLYKRGVAIDSDESYADGEAYYVVAMGLLLVAVVTIIISSFNIMDALNPIYSIIRSMS